MTEVADENAVHPLLSVTLTESDSELNTVMDAELAPLLQLKVVPPVAVRITESPRQKFSGPFAVIIAFGELKTVTGTTAEVEEHPPAFVTVTEQGWEILTVIA